MGSVPPMPSIEILLCSRRPEDCFSPELTSSIKAMPIKWPLTLLAGVGNELVVLTVGCCETWVDIGVDERGDDKGCPCDVARPGDAWGLVKAEA